MGKGKGSCSDLAHPFSSFCLPLPSSGPLPQLFGSFDYLTLYGTRVANAFCFRMRNFPAVIFCPLSITSSNHISSFCPKNHRILFTPQHHCRSFASKDFVSHSEQSMAVACEWVILYTQDMCIYLHIYIPLTKTNIKFSKPSSRE